ncbi:MAG: hypothetical protein JWM47_1305 [Acidimicrobiales bacterium]|nr:hypothetical protein [Acidimicrobiales bacterium]
MTELTTGSDRDDAANPDRDPSMLRVPAGVASDEVPARSAADPSGRPDDQPIELTDDRPDDRPDDGTQAPFPTLRRRLRAAWRRLVTAVDEDPGRAAEALCSLVVVLLGTALVIATLQPSDLWSNTTPTGGDMGAHVWGPRYLLDHLLPHGRLSGWTPDWYDGFPAFQFYMVVPALVIVALHVGLAWPLAIPVVLALLGVAALGWAKERLYPYRYLIATAVAVAIVVAVPVPYNRSFKLVTALGLLGIPLACWALAKLADLPFPIPPLASAAGLLFIYNREPLFNNTGNIIGGNFQSTMAGEFAFSISLTLSLVYLGVASRGLRTGRHRALAAALFALAGLCHLIPAFFVLACTGALFLLHPDRARLKWLATMVPVAGLLTAFWVVPFWWRKDYVNDMGWERLPQPRAQVGAEALKIAGDESSVWYYLLPHGMRWLMIAALVGIVVSVIRRYTVGMVLATAWAGVMVAFTYLPDWRLWNARLLPFMYLSVALLAAIGLGEVIRVAGSVAIGRADRSYRPVTVTVGSLVALGVLVFVALPLQGLFEDPVGGFVPVKRTPVTVYDADGSTSTATRSSPGILGGLGGLFDTTDSNPVAGWAKWNYSGLEAKEAQPPGCDAPGSKVNCTTGGWPEYRDLMATMAALGKDPEAGCGRAFWEYANDPLNGYGTPMAPMLLPYWTDGCIGSQEGLYFEASTTTPYHFLMQAELSDAGSNPQRDLPYPSFDLTNGVRHMRMLGVRYYLATSSRAVQAADRSVGLTKVASSGKWHVYEVADAPTVEALQYEPVVWRNVGEGQTQWLDPAVAWFLDPTRGDVPMAVDGPASWARATFHRVDPSVAKLVGYVRGQMGRSAVVDQLPPVPHKRLPAVRVSNTKMGDDHLSFDVSRTGVPVVVKVSYFPNWKVDGAEGPYRITPNLMVVIPRSTHVSMHFGRTGVDIGATALSVAGVGGLVVLARLPALPMPATGPSWLARWWQGRRPVSDDDDAAGSGDGPPLDGDDDPEGDPDDDERWWAAPDAEPPAVVPVSEPDAPVAPRTALPAPEVPGG